MGGTVTGQYEVGGLIGYNCYGRVTDCGTATTVIGRYYTGGLLGANQYGTIARCRSTEWVTGEKDTGGLVGNERRGTITDCYSIASVVGLQHTGGLLGDSSGGTVRNCYAVGPVVGTEDTGGFVGEHSSVEPVASFWDMEASGITASAGGTGLTTGEMMTTATFLEAGWDFVGETENGTEEIWWIDEGQDYPRLWWEGEF